MAKHNLTALLLSHESFIDALPDSEFAEIERRAAENIDKLIDLMEARDAQWKRPQVRTGREARPASEEAPRAPSAPPRRIPTGTWHDLAACLAQPGDWVYTGSQRTSLASQKAAKVHELAFCAVCTVRRECLEDGLNEEHGIRGGLLPKERRRLR
jgi:uncharacterized membrane protein